MIGVEMMTLYTFQDEKSLVKKITELKLNYIKTRQMTVVSNKRPTKEFKHNTDVEFVKGDGTIWERTVGGLFNKSPESLISRRFNLDGESLNTYHEALINGEFILIINDGKKEVEIDDETDLKPKSEANHVLEDEEFVEILDSYGLNSERSFIEENNKKTKRG